jgi:hypothetical protein
VPILETVCNDASQNRKCNSGGDDQGGSLSHILDAPLNEVGIAWFTTTGKFTDREYVVLHSTTVQSNTPESVLRESLDENGRGTDKEGVEDGAMQMQ